MPSSGSPSSRLTMMTQFRTSERGLLMLLSFMGTSILETELDLWLHHLLIEFS
jgi:hypothetical protein